MADFDDILLYTELNWGDKQRDDYQEALISAFEHLASFPHLGSARPDIRAMARSLQVKQHIIVFHATETELHITRIYHVRQDVNAELDD